jgi:hypothetical protein
MVVAAGTRIPGPVRGSRCPAGKAGSAKQSRALPRALRSRGLPTSGKGYWHDWIAPRRGDDTQAAVTL